MVLRVIILTGTLAATAAFTMTSCGDEKCPGTILTTCANCSCPATKTTKCTAWPEGDTTSRDRCCICE